MHFIGNNVARNPLYVHSGGHPQLRRGSAAYAGPRFKPEASRPPAHATAVSPRSSGPLCPPAGQIAPIRSLAACFQPVLASLVLLFGPCATADAVLVSPSARIPRTVEVALRRSIPAENPTIGAIQKSVEDVGNLMRIPQRKPWGSMASNVATSLDFFNDRAPLLDGTPPAASQRGAELLDQLYSRLKELQLAIGSQQPDVVSSRVATVLQVVSDLELLQAPALPYILPKEYAGLPHLTGRAVVRLEIERPEGPGAPAFVKSEGGGTSNTRDIELTLDGYSAPITAGNFLVNVEAGLYDGRPTNPTYASVLVEADVRHPRPPVPLEILQVGEFEPVYRLPLDVQDGELPRLPLSIPGAVAMAHLPESDSYVAGDTFFIGKFTKQQGGLARLAFDEGAFGVFGYVTRGMDVVDHLQPGDVIRRAQVISGEDRLVRPGLEAPVAPGRAAGATAGTLSAESP